MLFSLEDDKGNFLRFYVIPDAGGATASVTLSSNKRHVATVAANKVRQEIVNAGRHATGMVGFEIDETQVPDLASYPDLEVREQVSNMLIYRRPQPSMVPGKLFRLETHLLPLRRFDGALENRFQYWYEGIGRAGHETTTQTFCLANCSSLYISGYLTLRRLGNLLNDTFRCLVLFRDPFREMAERLLLFKNMTEDAKLLGERDLFAFKEIIGLVKEFEALDERFCKEFFRYSSAAALAPLANPFVRQLASSDADEPATSRSVATALQTLSVFDVVGIRDDAQFFSASVAELAGVDAASLPVMHDYSKVIELGEMLRRFPKAEAILEHDLEIYEHVRQAFATLPKQERTTASP